MRCLYNFTLTGDADGLPDVVIPMESFSFRELNGKPSTLDVVIPTLFWVSDIAERPNGDMVIALYNGATLIDSEFARANFGQFTPSYGAMNSSVSLSGSKQITRTPPVQPVLLPAPISRAPNQTDGRWTYQFAAPIVGIHAGWTVQYADHVFVAGEIQYQIGTSNHSVYIKEQETA